MTRLVMGFLALTILAVPAGAAAQDSEWNRYTLEELGGVYVSSEIGDACTAAGVTDAALRTEAEGVLTTAEVELLSETGMLANPALPELRVSVDCAPTDGSVAYVVSIRMHQAVQMVRDPQITLSEGVTWFATAMGVSSASDVAAAVAAAVTEQIGAFAVAYAEANAG